jgi:hypothetical protein
MLGCYGAAPSLYGFENLAASGQIYFENVVKLFPKHHLQALAQTGGWSGDAERHSFREEDNSSLSVLIEVNSHEGLLRPIRLPEASAKGAARTANVKNCFVPHSVLREFLKSVTVCAMRHCHGIAGWRCHLDGPLSEA